VSPILLNFEERSLPFKSHAAPAVSFDHLVGCGEEHRGNLDVKRHGGRQINSRIEFCRLSGVGLQDGVARRSIVFETRKGRSVSGGNPRFPSLAECTVSLGKLPMAERDGCASTSRSIRRDERLVTLSCEERERIKPSDFHAATSRNAAQRSPQAGSRLKSGVSAAHSNVHRCFSARGFLPLLDPSHPSKESHHVDSPTRERTVRRSATPLVSANIVSARASRSEHRAASDHFLGLTHRPSRRWKRRTGSVWALLFVATEPALFARTRRDAPNEISVVSRSQFLVFAYPKY
jgi:hypothetical protein